MSLYVLCLPWVIIPYVDYWSNFLRCLSFLVSRIYPFTLHLQRDLSKICLILTPPRLNGSSQHSNIVHTSEHEHPPWFCLTYPFNPVSCHSPIRCPESSHTDHMAAPTSPTYDHCAFAPHISSPASYQAHFLLSYSPGFSVLSISICSLPS